MYIKLIFARKSSFLTINFNGIQKLHDRLLLQFESEPLSPFVDVKDGWRPDDATWFLCMKVDFTSLPKETLPLCFKFTFNLLKNWIVLRYSIFNLYNLDFQKSMSRYHEIQLKQNNLMMKNFFEAESKKN